MKKLSLLVFFALCLGFTNSSSGQPNGKVIRFGLITDIQYADADTKGTRFYRNSLKKLNDCIGYFNENNIPFILNLGDVTDHNPNDLVAVTNELRKAKSTVYTTPGNHDYGGVKDNNGLFRRLGMPREYYSFKKGEWRFVMLNTNEVASYSNVSGSWKEKELEEMVKKIQERKGVNGAEYNGGISSKQMQWLQELLQTAEKKGEKVLIFSHHPFACANALAALNSPEVVSLVSKFGCVKALIAGHHHAGAYCQIGSLPCIVAEGMVETADLNSYGVVELYADKLVLTGYGRMTSRVIEFKNVAVNR